MKRNVIVKISVFSVMSIAFVFYLFSYSNALAKGKIESSIDFGKDLFLSKIACCGDFSFTKESNLAEKDSIVKNFSVDPKGTLKLDVSIGDIKITAWDKNEVKVVVQRKGTEKTLEEHKLSFESTKNSVTIKSENNKNFKPFGIGRNLSITFDIFVPKQFYPDIRTSGGDISIADLFSDSKLITSGGDIRILNSTGNSDIKTSGGDIKISSNKGNIKAITSGGDIVFKEINGDVDVITSGGDITFREIRGRIKASTSGGDIEAEILGENKGVSLSTSGGDIDIVVADNIKADLDCKTIGGDVSLSNSSNFNGTVKSSSIVGKLNGGGPAITAKTSGGDIDIKFKK